MEGDGGKAVEVGLEHALDDFHVLDVSRALIMDHHIVASGIPRISMDGKRRAGAAVIDVDLGDLGVDAFLDTLLEQLRLGLVIMTATAGDEHDLERLFSRMRETNDGEKGEERNGFHGMSGME
jgi:hypothetical protein